MKIDRIALFGLALPALLLASVFPIKRIVVRSIYKQKSQRLESAWGMLTYSPIDRTTNFFEQVRGEIARRIDMAEVLDQRQKDNLVASVVALLRAYNSKDYDEYRSFRLPVDPNLRGRLNASNTRGILAKLGTLEPKSETSTNLTTQATVPAIRPSDLLRDYYLHYGLSATNAEGKPLFCTDCWKGIAFETMRVHINRFTNGVESISGVFWREHDLTGASFVPTIEFQPTPQAICRERTGLTSAYFSCVVRTDTSVTNHSIYFHWYWDPEVQHWIPYEFRAGFAKQTLSFVF